MPEDVRRYSLSSQIAEVRRELALRRNVYPGLVRSRRMKESEAEIHMDVMKSVLATLEELQAKTVQK